MAVSLSCSRSIFALCFLYYFSSLINVATSTSAVRQLPHPPATDKENKCTTSGSLLTPPTKCPPSLKCVLFDFGFPAVDKPNVGTCEKPPSPLVDCSIAFCSSTPTESAVCMVSGQVATCKAWATRMDGSDEIPNCNFPCTKECIRPLLVASDGSTYCNACILSQASCASNFQFYGPVEPKEDPCENPSVFEAANCCIEQEKGCTEVGENCSTMGSRIRPVPCVEGATCVIEDFGFPAADRPNSGTCSKLNPRRIRNCNLKLCVKNGSNQLCQLRKQNIFTTCGAWSKRSDGGRNPKCSRRCNGQPCVEPKHERPRGSDGKFYCNLCYFKMQSCFSGFELYGPL